VDGDPVKQLTSPVVSLLVLLATITAGTVLAALHIATPTWFSVVIGLVGGHAATAGGLKLFTPTSSTSTTSSAPASTSTAAKTSPTATTSSAPASAPASAA